MVHDAHAGAPHDAHVHDVVLFEIDSNSNWIYMEHAQRESTEKLDQHDNLDHQKRYGH